MNFELGKFFIKKIVMKSILFFLFVLFCFSCKTKPFLKHELEYKKISETCTGKDPMVRMNSNLNGERYEFQECLDDDFDGKTISVDRKGDTVVVSFRKAQGKKARALFGITLDIDSYPRYNFMSISDNVFPITPAGN
jgi:hypothetical protein